jgi:hypothetical protein
MTRRQVGIPLLVDGFGADAQCQALMPVSFSKSNGAAVGYDEHWLQHLIMKHPQLLPIDRIEPGLIPLVPVGMEIQTAAGFIDNLFVTPNGDIAIAECKLWRNPEARREVVAQILDYAKELSRWSFQDLERAVQRLPGCGELTLYELVKPITELEEGRFIDAISRNLRRGRLLLMIVGDGIREGVDALAEFLQQHAGLHFTLALVELNVFEIEGDRWIVQPSVPAKTALVHRGIIEFDGASAILKPPSADDPKTKPTNITDERFYEMLEAAYAGASKRLQAFLDRLEELGVRPDIKKTLSLKWLAPSGTELNLGSVYPDGNVDVVAANWSADSLGRLADAHNYGACLAGLIPGGYVKKTAKPVGWYPRSTDTLKVWQLLDHEDAWLSAIKEFQRRLSATEDTE